MIPAYDLIVLGLASGRIAYCVSKEDIFQPLRERIAARDQINGGGPYDGEGFLLGAISCPWCLSFWTSLLVLAAYWIIGSATITYLTAFALWGLATIFVARGYEP